MKTLVLLFVLLLRNVHADASLDPSDPVRLTESERKQLLEYTDTTRVLLENGLREATIYNLEEAEIFYRELAQKVVRVSLESEPRLELISRIALNDAIRLVQDDAPAAQTMGRGVATYILEQSLALALEYLPQERVLISAGSPVTLPVLKYSVARMGRCVSWAAFLPEAKLMHRMERRCAEHFIQNVRRARPGDRISISKLLGDLNALLELAEKDDSIWPARFLLWRDEFRAHLPQVQFLTKTSTAVEPIEVVVPPSVPKDHAYMDPFHFGGSVDVALGKSDRSDAWQGEARISAKPSGFLYSSSKSLDFGGMIVPAEAYAAFTLGTLTPGGRTELTRFEIGADRVAVGGTVYLGAGHSLSGFFNVASASYMNDRRLGLTIMNFHGLAWSVGALWNVDRALLGDDRFKLSLAGDISLASWSSVITTEKKAEKFVEVTRAHYDPSPSAILALSYVKEFGRAGAFSIADQFSFRANYVGTNEPVLRLENHSTLGWSPSLQTPPRVRAGYLVRRTSIEGPLGQKNALGQNVTDHFITLGAELP